MLWKLQIGIYPMENKTLATSKGASCFEIVLNLSRSIKEASTDFTLLCEGIQYYFCEYQRNISTETSHSSIPNAFPASHSYQIS